jgi:glycosyltransferase involved in cell wall biosynthesis
VPAIHAPLKVALLADAVLSSLDRGATGRPDGSAASWLPSCAEALTNREDLEITWISLVRGLSHRRESSRGRHRFIELPAFPVSVDTWLGYRVARRKLLTEIRVAAPDLVHVWGSESPYPSVLGFLSCPAVLSLNGILATLNGLNLLPTGRWWQRQAAFERVWLKQADAILVESEWTQKEVRSRLGEAKTFLAPYGVHPSFYGLEPSPDLETPYLLFAGTLSQGKGLDLLLDALELLSDRRWVCRIAGDGPLRATLISRRIPGVEWLGSLAWPEYQEVLRRASCLVLPTRADSHPNVVKEARVVGLPIITTRQGGQADYLIEGENALLLDHPDAASLARAMDAWMRDPQLLRATGEKGHREDRRRFESSATAAAFAGAYHAVAHPAGSKRN